MKTEEYIGKTFQLLNVDDSVMEEFIIKHVKVEHVPSMKYDDGSESPSRERILVSGNGSVWHILYQTDKIF